MVCRASFNGINYHYVWPLTVQLLLSVALVVIDCVDCDTRIGLYGHSGLKQSEWALLLGSLCMAIVIMSTVTKITLYDYCQFNQSVSPLSL